MIYRISDELSKLIKSQQYVHDSYIVAKELIENSLDAGSSRISVAITETSISVEDNGCGIEDLDLICKPGFTSKEDTSYRVLGISYSNSKFTHGFRGQALSAISEMCDVEITSRTSQKTLGLCKNYTTGRTEMKPREQGTTVKVENMFKRCPIRQQSNRKTIRKSLAKIINLIKAYLYVYPVYFKLVFNSCTLISECGDENTTDIAISKHGPVHFEIRDEKFKFLLFPFDKSSTQVIMIEKRVCKFERVSQLVSKIFEMYFAYPPTYILTLRDECDVNLSVDKTEVILRSSKYVENRIKSELDRYFALKLYIRETSHIDEHCSTNEDVVQNGDSLTKSTASDENKNFEVASQMHMKTNTEAESTTFEGNKNHPEDTLNGQSVFSINCLKPENTVEYISASEQDKCNNIDEELETLYRSHANTNADDAIGLNDDCGSSNVKRSRHEIGSQICCKTHYDHGNIAINTSLDDNNISMFDSVICSSIGEVPTRRIQDDTTCSVYNFIKEESLGHSRLVFDKSDFKEMHIIGQFNQGFILCILKKGNSTFLIAVDQHAADEIYNFERLKCTFKLKKQRLLTPIQLEFSPIQRLLIEEHKQTLEDNGFVISENLLLSFPVYQGVFFSVEDFYSILDSISKGILVPEKFKNIMASKACRSSIMIGTSLSMKEMRRILDNLSVLDLPWNCPHGRPTFKVLCEMKSIKSYPNS
ncbi:uncharacterized protein VICG_00441 [Vittaforma corneae ATCC 50505]|uniref:MutL C-terminal dimerisation domain-containing protein n=1 Tax=Vittaforma corneae (strain ATCC 50505) TaxID=993615 RepID=L2GN66_VITCO|nr:uncharacterized protein VICG_00441 [Vittaforma corneae ATCC 50505]ELA42343.1 hypothetical protein VICG_00441 [Vittaforma corneae ATCC 50505]